jgi:hypothetical protein
VRKYSEFKKVLQKIQVVRPPKYHLSTFGSTKINYTLVTDVPGLPDRARLRFGVVMAEKPAIITLQTLQEKFLGFGDEPHEYAQWLTNQYGEALKGLEYQFHNEAEATRVELTSPDTLVRDLTREFDRRQDPRNTLIKGIDQYWQLSLMKFIVEETLSSFQNNVRELDERGFFDGDEKKAQRRRDEIKNLIIKARNDASLVPLLGQKLKEYALFEEYQDEFFQLCRR